MKGLTESQGAPTLMPAPDVFQILFVCKQFEHWGVMQLPRYVDVSLQLQTFAFWDDVILSHVCCVTGWFKL